MEGKWSYVWDILVLFAFGIALIFVRLISWLHERVNAVLVADLLVDVLIEV